MYLKETAPTLLPCNTCGAMFSTCFLYYFNAFFHVETT
jgi:hypothetical protein